MFSFMHASCFGCLSFSAVPPEEASPIKGVGVSSDFDDIHWKQWAWTWWLAVAALLFYSLDSSNQAQNWAGPSPRGGIVWSPCFL